MTIRLTKGVDLMKYNKSLKVDLHKRVQLPANYLSKK